MATSWGTDSGLTCMDLFAGGGGLSLAAHTAGLTTKAFLEIDPHACDLLRQNLGIVLPSSAKVIQQDVADISGQELRRTIGDVDVLIGGPPCQPFSMGGHRLGKRDERNLFPDLLEIVSELRPKAFIFENVAGLSTRRFNGYLSSILNGLAFCLTGSHQRNRPDYLVKFKVLEAADFGVPQYRRRLFIVGFRKDLSIDWVWPEPTHSRERLLFDQFVTEEYFDRHGIPSKRISPKLLARVDRVMDSPRVELEPHQTIRDAISDLPHPRVASQLLRGRHHIYVPGAKIYPGHTGSAWDLPAKTIKAGVNGCPGGENMVADGGRARYFTIRELARLQTFPDKYGFLGARSECVRRLGNAVPVKLGHVLIAQLVSELRKTRPKVEFSRKSDRAATLSLY